MRKPVWWLVSIAVVSLAVVIFYYALQKIRPQPAPALPDAAPTVPAAPAEPQVRFPIPQGSPEPPLPALNESDATMKQALDGLWSDKTLERLLRMKDFIRNVVATIDNLPRSKLALRLMPVEQTGGKFLATGKDETLVISTANASRYASYVYMAEAIDPVKAVAIYVRFYPLFQQAYQELGYPKGYFNDRLVVSIDHVLATPEVQAPVKLVQPKVLYEFADPDLQARSAGQKILLRIGSQNAARIKAKLREIRSELIRQTPEQ
jgi:hypothetical protein